MKDSLFWFSCMILCATVLGHGITFSLPLWIVPGAAGTLACFCGFVVAMVNEKFE